MLRVFAAAATGFGVGAAVFLPSQATRNHCQVPCGIFDDKAKIAELQQHTTTIAKAINQVQTLAAQKDAQSLNQSGTLSKGYFERSEFSKSHSKEFMFCSHEFSTMD